MGASSTVGVVRAAEVYLDLLQMKCECQGMMKLIEGALPPSPPIQGAGLCSKGHEYDSTYWYSKGGGTARLQPSQSEIKKKKTFL